MVRFLSALGLASTLLLSPVAHAAEEYLNPSALATLAPVEVEAEWADEWFSGYSYETADVAPRAAEPEQAFRSEALSESEIQFIEGYDYSTLFEEATAAIPAAPVEDLNPNGLLDHDRLGLTGNPAIFGLAPASEPAPAPSEEAAARELIQLLNDV